MNQNKLEIKSRWLVQWNQDEFWYPATVLAVDDARESPIYVRFDDGDKQWCTSDQLSPIDVEVGDRVHARWEGETEDEEESGYFRAHVVDVKGDRYGLHYDDGSQCTATISMLRVTR